MPTSEEFDLLHPFTVTLWIYREPGAVQDAHAPFVTKGDGTWRIQANGQGETVGFHMATDQGALFNDAPADAIEDGKWHHVAAVFTGKANQVYVGGRLLSERKRETEVRVKTHGRPVRIGGNVDAPDRDFFGRIDDVRIYKRALERSEIQKVARGQTLE
ncbi:MAG: LamG domain-containing protein [Verrucomicrobiota bacterium]